MLFESLLFAEMQMDGAHMDIKSAETAVNKLLKYVTDLNNQDVNMYSKSKQRLREIASMCDEVIKIISMILKDESLECSSVEFESDSSAEISDFISSMQTELKRLESFVSPTVISSLSDKKSALIQYGNTFKQCISSQIPYLEAQTCAKLLWMWFDERFFISAKNYPNFRYNMQKFPEWVSSIVLMYSKYLQEGKEVEFIKIITDWCNSLSDPKIGSRYAIPYQLYQFRTKLSQSDVTLSAVVIWDILLDHGFKDICKDDSSGLFLSEDTLYKLCSMYNPSQLDWYVDYKEDSSILNRCNIHLGGQSWA